MMLCYQCNGNVDLVQEVCQAKKAALSDVLLRRETPYQSNCDRGRTTALAALMYCFPECAISKTKEN